MSHTPESPFKKREKTSLETHRQDIEPDDTPDFAEEFTTSGTEKNYWKNPNNKENSRELLI